MYETKKEIIDRKAYFVIRDPKRTILQKVPTTTTKVKSKLPENISMLLSQAYEKDACIVIPIRYEKGDKVVSDDFLKISLISPGSVTDKTGNVVPKNRLEKLKVIMRDGYDSRSYYYHSGANLKLSYVVDSFISVYFTLIYANLWRNEHPNSNGFIKMSFFRDEAAELAGRFKATEVAARMYHDIYVSLIRARIDPIVFIESMEKRQTQTLH